MNKWTQFDTRDLIFKTFTGNKQEKDPVNIFLFDDLLLVYVITYSVMF